MGEKIQQFEGEASFVTYEQVFIELRARAAASVARNEHIDKSGQPVRVRIKDEQGKTLFDGTMMDARRAYPAVDEDGVLISVCRVQ